MSGPRIGVAMLILTLSGGLGLIVKWIPLCMVRGVQFLLVGVIALTVPHGFAVGLVLGTLVFYGFTRFGRTSDELDKRE